MEKHASMVHVLPVLPDTRRVERDAVPICLVVVRTTVPVSICARIPSTVALVAMLVRRLHPIVVRVRVWICSPIPNIAERVERRVQRERVVVVEDASICKQTRTIVVFVAMPVQQERAVVVVHASTQRMTPITVEVAASLVRPTNSVLPVPANNGSEEANLCKDKIEFIGWSGGSVASCWGQQV